MAHPEHQVIFDLFDNPKIKTEINRSLRIEAILEERDRRGCHKPRVTEQTRLPRSTDAQRANPFDSGCEV